MFRTSKKLSSVLSTRPAIGSLCGNELRGSCRDHIRPHLARQDAPIELQIAAAFDHPKIRGNFLAHADVDEVSGDEIGCSHGLLPVIAKDLHRRREHALDRRHDPGGGNVLPRDENSLKDDDDEKNHSER